MKIVHKLGELLREGLNQAGDYNYVTSKVIGTSIPLVVHQSYFSKDLPEAIQANIDALKLANPLWQFRLYDDADIEQYIQTHYPDLFTIYQKINVKYGAARVDFFRYLLIYNEGGVYLDIKSSLSKPLNEIIEANDQYLLSHWPNSAGQAYENSGIYVDLPSPLGEFQQWHIIAVKGHPFLKSVIENVCNNIINYNPFIHHTGQTGVFRVTGPVAYTLAIMPHVNQFNHRLVRSHHELNLIYSIFSDNKDYKHRLLFKNHYSTLSEPVTNMPYFSRLLFKIYQPIKDRLILILKKLR